MSAPLTERILQAIARADSRKPADADAIAASIGGVSRAAFDAAVIELEQQRRICLCLITRDGLTRMVMWPTGVTVPHASWNGGAWSNAAHSHLFVPDEPRRFPVAPRKTPKEKSMHTSIRRPSEDKLDAIKKAIAGRGKADAVKLADIGKTMGLEPSIASATLKSALQYLVNAGKAATVKRKAESGQMDMHVFDPTVDAPPAEAAPADTAAERPTPADQPEELRFGLWDDGTLTIMAGDDVIQLNTHQVSRLALLLGVSADSARAHIK